MRAPKRTSWACNLDGKTFPEGNMNIIDDVMFTKELSDGWKEFTEVDPQTLLLKWKKSKVGAGRKARQQYLVGVWEERFEKPLASTVKRGGAQKKLKVPKPASSNSQKLKVPKPASSNSQKRKADELSGGTFDDMEGEERPLRRRKVRPTIIERVPFYIDEPSAEWYGPDGPFPQLPAPLPRGSSDKMDLDTKVTPKPTRSPFYKAWDDGFSYIDHSKTSDIFKTLLSGKYLKGRIKIPRS